MPRPAVRLAAIALTLVGWRAASAQVMLGARDTTVIRASPAATVSAVLRVSNRGVSRAALVPRIELPAEWSAPMGALPFEIAPGQADNWIVSVRIPARAAAGRYDIGIIAEDSTTHALLRDSLRIDVLAIKGLELSLTNRPTYAVSGTAYRTSFMLQNKGNVVTTVVVSGKSALGGLVAVDSTRLVLTPGASLPFAVRVATTTKGQQAQDDILEMKVVDADDAANVAEASARVTIVQEANTSEPMHRIGSRLRLRAANASAGVSPYELTGAGMLRDGGNDELSYVLRGSPGARSQFGDQDEYRIGLRGKNYNAKLGDGLYQVSSLSNNGQTGFGGGLEVARGDLTAGAIVQRFRFQPDSPTETGAFVGAQAPTLFGAPRLTVSALNRNGGYMEGRVLGTGLTVTPLDLATVELEVAGSNGPLGSGRATSARVTGGSDVHYDLGHIGADAPFAGSYRGATHDYGSFSAKLNADFQLNAAIGVHKSESQNLGLFAPQSFRSSGVTLDYRGKYTLQYSGITRNSTLAMTALEDRQRGVLARAEQNIGAMHLWGGIGTGMSTTFAAPSHRYHEYSVGVNTLVGQNSFSAYGESSDGESVSRGADRVMTFGADGRLLLGTSTWVTFSGFRTAVPSSGDHNSQVDVSIAQTLSTGATIGMRMRTLTNIVDVSGRRIAFLEYTMPLQMPVGRARVSGRARGRVVDQETGQGVAGTLVRLGPQAAITDREGRVAFAGLPTGEYRLSIAQQATQTATVFTGDPTVRIDSTRTVPITFALAVERAGTVAGSVRLMSVARKGIGSAPDSLADAGPVADVTLALIGVRDTLFAVTDATGGYRFNEVVSGSYMLKSLTEAPAGMRWEPTAIDVSVKPGSANEVTFRQVPRRRAVQMIPSDINPARK